MICYNYRVNGTKVFRHTVTSVYFLLLGSLLTFPIYYRHLEPYQYNLDASVTSQTSIFNGQYGYIKVLPFVVVFSMAYWLVAGIAILSSKQEANEYDKVLQIKQQK